MPNIKWEDLITILDLSKVVREIHDEARIAIEKNDSIKDIEGSDEIRPEFVSESIQYRSLDRTYGLSGKQGVFG